MKPAPGDGSPGAAGRPGLPAQPPDEAPNPYAPPSAAGPVPSWAGPLPGPVPPWDHAPVLPPPPAPPRGRPRWQVVTVAGACVLALVAVSVGVGLSHRDAPLTPQQRAALAASRARVVLELPRLQAWIAGDRGLQWKHPVTPEVLSDADFVKALDSGADGGTSTSADDPDDVGTTFAAMGLVKSADSFYSADSSATNSDVVGFYDDTSKRLVVRGTAWTPTMEYTLVHELTHALQDQNFGLSRIRAAVRTDDESALTRRALIEGDAERVADHYYDEQPAAWQDAVDAAEGSAPPASEPIVDTYEALPYAFGESFVDGLFAVGGNAAIDQAFHAPPSTSQQLLHPAEWIDGERPAPAALAFPAAPPGDVADKGVLGQLGLWAAVEGRDPKPADAAKLDGWAGDAYVATHGDSGACFVDELRFDSTRSRTSGLAFLGPWISAEHIAALDEGDRAVRLSACRG